MGREFDTIPRDYNFIKYFSNFNFLNTNLIFELLYTERKFKKINYITMFYKCLNIPAEPCKQIAEPCKQMRWMEGYVTV